MISAVGKHEYEVYRDAVGGVNFLGQPMPTWEALTDAIRAGWAAIANEGDPVGLPDIEVRFKDDGTASVIDRTVEGEYNHNIASFTMTKEEANAIFFAPSLFDWTRANAADLQEWYEPRPE